MSNDAKYAKPSAGGTWMRIAFVLLILLIASVCMMGGLLARYNGTGSDNDSARVAKFDVKVSGAPDESDIICKSVSNGSGIYTITVENRSEVAVHYELSVTVTGDPEFIEGSFAPAEGDLAVGEVCTSTLTFTVDWDQFTKTATGPSASQELEFTVTVDVAQID